KNNNNNFKESENYETEVDPNDHVDIELWNKLNEQDMKNMPEIIFQKIIIFAFFALQ
ncbi:unnamed protein product, partial [Rotaria sp. Silwood2]